MARGGNGRLRGHGFATAARHRETRRGRAMSEGPPTLGHVVSVSGSKATAILVNGAAAKPDGAGDFPFRRGVSVHPALQQPIFAASSEDLARIYARPAASNARIGRIHQSPDLPAFVVTDRLLGEHFAILGTTGSGKAKFANDGDMAEPLMVDTPVPYRLSDLLKHIDEAMGRLNKADGSA